MYIYPWWKLNILIYIFKLQSLKRAYGEAPDPPNLDELEAIGDSGANPMAGTAGIPNV